MSAEGNKEFMRKCFEELNMSNGDASKIRSFYSKYYEPTAIAHVTWGGDINLEHVIQEIIGLFVGFPDLKFIVDEMLADSDKVVTRYTMKGTHKGLFTGIPATGKPIVVKGVQIDKIAGGKRVENWDFPDLLGMMTQLGVVPGAAPPK